MYFDTHAHYFDEWFEEDREKIMTSLPDYGISLVMNAGDTLETSRISVRYSEQYPFFYAAVGIHPHDARAYNEETELELEKLAGNKKVKAIGEIGLDYHYDAEWKETQIEVLERQFCLAEKLNLPVIIHDRDGHKDSLDAVMRHPNLKGEFHCFSGSWEMAKQLLDRGWYLGFNGAITMQGARRSHEVLKNMPAEFILLETDCPYLAPMPRLDGKRNDSRKLPRVAEVIAEIRNSTVEEIAECTLENGKRFFCIDI